MATWQFDLYIVPREKLVEVAGVTAQRISQQQFEQTEWWEGASLPPHYVQVLTTLLPRAESWSPGVEIWGTEDGNRIDVYRSGGAVQEVRFRIDVRAIDVGVLEAVARFADNAGCALLTEEFEVVPPTLDAMLKEIRNSSAHRFLLDPGAFLEQGDIP
jgi:hypothetical protein